MIGTDAGAAYRVFSLWQMVAERDVYELQKALYRLLSVAFANSGSSLHPRQTEGAAGIL
ncbi:hypothetical protein SUBVAR_06848 [Subdoligranulum variabile DSM 15176]|uniref:Uncharacterized protein n=1 Tax=Subdoligranulum variabile DSM 15176 TaxID=411471 RepID=D1PR21_9FIRM|nr:hypothetical protein SUBVAR_06848 [Subdoligranulum variabile DSM 15176]